MLILSCLAALLAGCSNAGEDNADAEQKEKTKTAAEEEAQEQHDEKKEEQKQQKAAVSKEEELIYKVNEANWTVQAEESEGDEVLLTFDDAPDGNAVNIAEILAENEVPAIFFVNGMFLKDEEGRNALKKIHDMGFAIGNHTTTHASLPDLSEEEQLEELKETDELVKEITGETPAFFRAPFGQNTSFSDEYVKKHGMIKMNWTYGYDFEAEYQEAEALTDITLNTELLTDGANILMHDREWTREALGPIIEGFNEKGYSFIDPQYIEKK
ncbi:polysaccharide deacetylase family protein [Marinococcus sp. PL1-022]|uniref:polysaccharide deacetylase family protein n=1 Tax=Marinococcus sp. PL1-022 TaxID=3095363 RepID=UPI0029C2DC39|nr:polysaccharide deacetylase family protein [Marinococcus sp. PL1-022]MDX6152339.1 polysaccharide deacetylase family protein [Marinococcus sp. PL1-022]